MRFPQTNKVLIDEKVGENAKLLEEHLRKIDWSVFVRAYLYGLGLFLLTVFSVLATIRLALNLF